MQKKNKIGDINIVKVLGEGNGFEIHGISKLPYSLFNHILEAKT